MHRKRYCCRLPSLSVRLPLAFAAVGVFLTMAVFCPAADEDTEVPRFFYVSPDVRVGDEVEGFDAVFATINDGVAQLKPGDTLIVGPGVYREEVILGAGGSRDRPITIRAEYPGWAEMRGSVRLDAWQPVAPFRHVHSAPLAESTSMVYELDTGTDYREVANLQMVERQPGSFFYCRDAKVVYVHPSDSAAMERHVVEASVLDYGIAVLDPPIFGARSPQIIGLIIEGLVVSGYARGGIYLPNAVDCQVLDCVVYHCRRGIFFRNAMSSRISGCRVFACHDPFHREMGNIGIMGYIADCVLENNIVHDTRSHGIRFYGGWYGSRMINNLAFDCRIGLQVKGYELDRQRAAHYLREFEGSAEIEDGLPNLIKGNVVHWATGSSGLYPSVFSTYIRNTAIPATSSNVRDRALNLEIQPGEVEAARFADPAYHDLRLQSDSPWRATGPDGEDPGFREFDGSVLYVGPDGDDAADGTSIRSAWASLALALERLEPGQTLYVLPGCYKGGVRVEGLHADADEPTRIRAHGMGEVIIDGSGGASYGLAIDNCSNLVIEGLTIRATLEAALLLDRSRDVRIRECRMVDNHGDGIRLGEGSQSVAVMSCILLDNGAAGLWLGGNCERVRVAGVVSRGNAVQVDAPHGMPSVFQSDYNNFGRGPVARVSGQLYSGLDEWRAAFGGDSFSADFAPGFVDEAARNLELRSDSLSRGRGYLGQPVGTSHVSAAERPSLRFSDVTILDVRPDAADIAWQTPGRDTTRIIAYGTDADALDQFVVYDLAYHYGRQHSVTLEGLERGQRYFFRVGNRELVGDSHPFHYYRYLWPERGPAWQEAHYGQLEKVDSFDSVMHSFVTPATFVTDQGRTFHVAPGGDDTASGVEDDPWRTLHRAGEMARAGDRIVVHSGVYPETIQPLRSGAPGAPIIFEAAPGARVEIDGARELVSSAVNLTNKHHIVIRGFFFFGQNEEGPFHRDNGQVLIVDSSNIAIESCVFDGRMNWIDGLRIHRSADVSVEDNIFISHHGAVKATDNRGTIDFNHNTFLGPTQNKIYAVRNGTIVIRNNLFHENLFPTKKHQYRVVVLRNDDVIMDHNCYIVDPANDERRFVDFGGPALDLENTTALPEQMEGVQTRVGIKGDLQEWVSRFGRGSNSVVIVSDPGWADPEAVRMVRLRRRGWPDRSWDFPRFERTGAALAEGSPLLEMAEGGLPIGMRLNYNSQQSSN